MAKPPKVARTVTALRAEIARYRARRESVALVPTMARCMRAPDIG